MRLRIKLLFFASLRELVGAGELEVSSAKNRITVKEAVDLIETVDKETRKIILERISKNKIKIIVDGELIDNTEIDSIYLRDGCALAFLPPMGGG